MSEAQLSIRSTRALVLARQLAREEHRTIAKVVELALEDRARRAQQAGESWSSFIDRLGRLPRSADEADVDLDALIREGRKPHRGVDLE